MSNDELENQNNSKKRYIALILSIIFSAGTGHFYVGKYKKAFTLFLLPFVVLIISLFIFSNFYLFLLSLVLLIAIYFYAIVDIWKSFPISVNLSQKYSGWLYLILFVLLTYVPQTIMSSFLNFDRMNFRTFIIPSMAMQNTLMKGDLIFAQKKENVNRNEIIIFHYPLSPETYFVKRIVAKGGDEIVYQDKHLYIHFAEGDEYIKKNYSEEKIKTFRDKLWVDNPYSDKYSGIQYVPNNHPNAFVNLIQRIGIQNDMSAIYIEELGDVLYKSQDGTAMNAFYKKVEKNHYYVMGDNRDNSADSRFWGSVPQSLIYGVPKMVYFNFDDMSRVGRNLQ